MLIFLIEYINFPVTFNLTGKDSQYTEIILPIMLAICLVLLGTFYAQNCQHNWWVPSAIVKNILGLYQQKVTVIMESLTTIISTTEAMNNLRGEFGIGYGKEHHGSEYRVGHD